MRFSSSFAMALGALLSLSSGCKEAVQPEPPVVVPPVSPPVARPNLTYAGNGLYVLYDDGKFVLQYGGEYPGRYSRADSVITFNFAAYSTAGPWQATGALSGDSLDVKYSIVMMLSEFEDGVYVRVP